MRLGAKGHQRGLEAGRGVRVAWSPGGLEAGRGVRVACKARQERGGGDTVRTGQGRQ